MDIAEDSTPPEQVRSASNLIDMTDGLLEIERFLATSSPFSLPDDELWQRMASLMAEIEGRMDSVQAARFEIFVDDVLLRQGLPSWSVVRYKINQHR